jgi:hypothetical protein
VAQDLNHVQDHCQVLPPARLDFDKQGKQRLEDGKHTQQKVSGAEVLKHIPNVAVTIVGHMEIAAGWVNVRILRATPFEQRRHEVNDCRGHQQVVAQLHVQNSICELTLFSFTQLALQLWPDQFAEISAY